MKIGPRVEDDVYQLLEEYLDATPLAVTQVLVVNQALREFLTPRVEQIRATRGSMPTTTEGEASGSADEGTRAG